MREISFYSSGDRVYVEVKMNVNHNYEPYNKGQGLYKSGVVEVGFVDEDKYLVYWDGFRFFEECSLEEFLKECKEELIEKGVTLEQVLEVYQYIKEAMEDFKRVEFL